MLYLGHPQKYRARYLPPVFFLEPPDICYKAICRWLLVALGLEVPRRSQAVNLGWLLLVPGLGPLIKRYGV